MTAAGPGWIYALPGSSLAPGLPAGAPALEALDDQPGPWQAWVLYGPPPQALAALARDDGASLDDWTRQLQLGARLKRRHRQRLTVLNTATLSAEATARLQRQLPELQHRPGGGEAAAPLELVARTVLRLDPALRAAYLDLEAEADGEADDGQAPWRQEPQAQDWLALLRQGRPRGEGEGPAGSHNLERQLRRQQDWLSLLHDTEVQLEHELASHRATVAAMAALLPALEAQLNRARRALEQTP